MLVTEPDMQSPNCDSVLLQIDRLFDSPARAQQELVLRIVLPE